MKKSNKDGLYLPHGQASRLVQLFAPSFDACMEKSGEGNVGQSFIWNPVLTDIHQQVVHAISPVLVEQHQHLGDPSPTLSLSLLALPTSSVQQQSARSQQPSPEETTPVVKSTL